MVMPLQSLPNQQAQSNAQDPQSLDPRILAAIQQSLSQLNEQPTDESQADENQYYDQGTPDVSGGDGTQLPQTIQDQMNLGGPQVPQQPQIDPAVQQLALQRQYEQYLAAQQMRAMQAQKDQYEEALVRQYIAEEFPEEQQAQAWETYQYQKQMQAAYQQAVAQAQQTQAAYRQMEQAITPLIKEQVIAKVSNDSGVPVEILRMAETPAEMQKIVQVMSVYRKQNNFQQRKVQGNDRPAQTTQQYGGTPNGEQLKEKYRNSGSLEDYVRKKYLGR